MGFFSDLYLTILLYVIFVFWISIVEETYSVLTEYYIGLLDWMRYGGQFAMQGINNYGIQHGDHFALMTLKIYIGMYRDSVLRTQRYLTRSYDAVHNKAVRFSESLAVLVLGVHTLGIQNAWNAVIHGVGVQNAATQANNPHATISVTNFQQAVSAVTNQELRHNVLLHWTSARVWYIQRYPTNPLGIDMSEVHILGSVQNPPIITG